MKTPLKNKVGRPYKNPNLIPQGLADHIRELRSDRNQLLAALKLVWSDTNARFGRDPVGNMPISEVIRMAIKTTESHMSPKELEAAAQNVADLEDAEYAAENELTEGL